MSSQQEKFVVSSGLPLLSDSASPRSKAIVGNVAFEFLHGTQARLEDRFVFCIAFVVYCLTRTFLCALQKSTELSGTSVKKLHKWHSTFLEFLLKVYSES